MLKSFTRTSDKPYDRHNYKMIYSNGNSVIFDNYLDAQAAWFEDASNTVNYIEVLDKKLDRGFK